MLQNYSFQSIYSICKSDQPFPDKKDDHVSFQEDFIKV